MIHNILPVLPYFRSFMFGTPVIPDIYWNAYSYEERIKRLCCTLSNILEYLDSVADAVNQNAKDIEELDATVEDRIQEGVERYIGKLTLDDEIAKRERTRSEIFAAYQSHQIRCAVESLIDNVVVNGQVFFDKVNETIEFDVNVRNDTGSTIPADTSLFKLVPASGVNHTDEFDTYYQHMGFFGYIKHPASPANPEVIPGSMAITQMWFTDGVVSCHDSALLAGDRFYLHGTVHVSTYGNGYLKTTPIKFIGEAAVNAAKTGFSGTFDWESEDITPRWGYRSTDGRNTPSESGFTDCAGLVYWAYNQTGWRPMGDHATMQSCCGYAIAVALPYEELDTSKLLPGDVIVIARDIPEWYVKQTNPVTGISSGVLTKGYSDPHNIQWHHIVMVGEKNEETGKWYGIQAAGPSVWAPYDELTDINFVYAAGQPVWFDKNKRGTGEYAMVATEPHIIKDIATYQSGGSTVYTKADLSETATVGNYRIALRFI